MDGHDYDGIAATGQREMADDGDVWQMVDIECPFCGHRIEWTGTRLACFVCEVIWKDDAEVERDRIEEIGR